MADNGDITPCEECGYALSKHASWCSQSLPTPRDFEKNTTSRHMPAVRPELDISIAYRLLIDAVDAFDRLSPEMRDKCANYIPRAKLVLLLDIVERYLKTP